MTKRKSVWIIVNFENKLLIAKRSKEVNNSKQWNFFGGNVDKNESRKKAAKRELFEEAGIKIRKRDLKKVLKMETKKRKMTFYEVILLEEPELELNKESSKFKWVDREWLDENLHKLHLPTEIYTRET